MVTHVLTITLLTDLHIRVSVKLCDVGSWNATLAVQAIHVLTDDVLEVILLRQLNHGHVGD